MNRRFVWPTALHGLVSLGLLVIVVRQRQRLQRLESFLHQNDELLHRSSDLDRLNLERTAEKSPAAQSALAASSLARQVKYAADRKALADRLKHDPAAAEVQRLSELRQLAIEFPRLRTLPLSPARRQALERLLIERDNIGHEISDEASTQGISDNAAIHATIQDARAEIDQDIHSQLGDDLWNQLQNQRQMAQYTYNAEHEIGEQLAVAGLPLDDDQLQA